MKFKEPKKFEELKGMSQTDRQNMFDQLDPDHQKIIKELLAGAKEDRINDKRF